MTPTKLLISGFALVLVASALYVVFTKGAALQGEPRPIAVGEPSSLTLFSFGDPFYHVQIHAPNLLSKRGSKEDAQCVELVAGEPSEVWFTVCVREGKGYRETGYWGETLSYFYDTNKRAWLTSTKGTGSSDQGGASVATTSATIVGTTATGDPIFLGTAHNSFSSRIIPLDTAVFVVISDKHFGNNLPPDSFIDRVAQTLTHPVEGFDEQVLSAAIANLSTAYQKVMTQ